MQSSPPSWETLNSKARCNTGQCPVFVPFVRGLTSSRLWHSGQGPRTLSPLHRLRASRPSNTLPHHAGSLRNPKQDGSRSSRAARIPGSRVPMSHPAERLHAIAPAPSSKCDGRCLVDISIGPCFRGRQQSDEERASGFDNISLTVRASRGAPRARKSNGHSRGTLVSDCRPFSFCRHALLFETW